MACRVYRAVKLGFIKDSSTINFNMTIQFNTAPEVSGYELPSKRPTFEESHNMQAIVDVTITTNPDMYGDHARTNGLSLVGGDSEAYV
jgi:hypothetical protein